MLQNKLTDGAVDDAYVRMNIVRTYVIIQGFNIIGGTTAKEQHHSTCIP